MGFGCGVAVIGARDGLEPHGLALRCHMPAGCLLVKGGRGSRGSGGEPCAAARVGGELERPPAHPRRSHASSRRHFTFPNVEQMGLMAVQIQSLSHGYDDNKLFSKANLVVERGERVALIGPNGERVPADARAREPERRQTCRSAGDVDYQSMAAGRSSVPLCPEPLPSHLPPSHSPPSNPPPSQPVQAPASPPSSD